MAPALDRGALHPCRWFEGTDALGLCMHRVTGWIPNIEREARFVGVGLLDERNLDL